VWYVSSDIDTALVCEVVYVSVMSVSVAGVEEIYNMYWFDTGHKKGAKV
jgi:hypothetical protein